MRSAKTQIMHESGRKSLINGFVVRWLIFGTLGRFNKLDIFCGLQIRFLCIEFFFFFFFFLKDVCSIMKAFANSFLL